MEISKFVKEYEDDVKRLLKAKDYEEEIKKLKKGDGFFKKSRATEGAVSGIAIFFSACF